MKITRKHGRRLLQQGKATEDGLVRDAETEGLWWVSVTRHDLQRTDHYPANELDTQRLQYKKLEGRHA